MRNTAAFLVKIWMLNEILRKVTQLHVVLFFLNNNNVRKFLFSIKAHNSVFLLQTQRSLHLFMMRRLECFAFDIFFNYRCSKSTVV